MLAQPGHRSLAEPVVVGHHVVGLQVWGHDPQDGVRAGQSPSGNIRVVVGARHDLNPVPGNGVQPGRVADDYTEVLSTVQQSGQYLAADLAGRGRDDDHGSPRCDGGISVR